MNQARSGYWIATIAYLVLSPIDTPRVHLGSLLRPRVSKKSDSQGRQSPKQPWTYSSPSSYLLSVKKSLVNKIRTLTPYCTARTVGKQVDEKKIQARVALGPSTAESQRGKTPSVLLGQRKRRRKVTWLPSLQCYNVWNCLLRQQERLRVRQAKGSRPLLISLRWIRRELTKYSVNSHSQEVRMQKGLGTLASKSPP